MKVVTDLGSIELDDGYLVDCVAQTMAQYVFEGRPWAGPLPVVRFIDCPPIHGLTVE